jgi:hypothetical protein
MSRNFKDKTRYRCLGHAAFMGKMERHTNFEKPQRKTELVRHRFSWDDNIKIDRREG